MKPGFDDMDNFLPKFLLKDLADKEEKHFANDLNYEEEDGNIFCEVLESTNEESDYQFPMGNEQVNKYI